jgi:hypothetical protein
MLRVTKENQKNLHLEYSILDSNQGPPDYEAGVAISWSTM